MCLVNTDPREPFAVRRGDRIAQLVIQRFETAAFVEADELPGLRPRGGRLRFDRRVRPGPAAAGGDRLGRHGTVRFGRKARAEESEDAGDDRRHREATCRGRPERATPRAGPYDASEIEDLEERECIDLGSLLVTPAGPMEMRLQVDEESGEVIAAVLVDERGRARAACVRGARGGGAWDELRPQISAETARMGGTATEEQGTFGTELVCVVPMQTPDGQHGTQVSRISGHEGPNWLLRATLMGQPAAGAATAAPWEETIRSVVVRRGREAMAPGRPAAAARCRPTRGGSSDPGRARDYPRHDYARPMGEHKSRLRASISRWANQDREEARELRKDTRKAGLVRDQRRPDREKRHRAGHAEDRHAAAARRRPGPRGGAVRRLRLDQRGLARTSPDRRHHARAVPSASRDGSASRTASG